MSFEKFLKFCKRKTYFIVGTEHDDVDGKGTKRKRSLEFKKAFKSNRRQFIYAAIRMSVNARQEKESEE